MVTSLTLTLTGAGSAQIGDIRPGWTVESQATPVTPGDESGSTGLANFGIDAIENPEFAYGADAELSDGDLGTIEGSVSSVSITGGGGDEISSLTLSTTTPLSVLTAERNLRPVQWGCPGGAVFNALHALGLAGYGVEFPGGASGGSYIPLLYDMYGYSMDGYDLGSTSFSSLFPTSTIISDESNTLDPTAEHTSAGGVTLSGSNWTSGVARGFDTGISVTGSEQPVFQYLVQNESGLLLQQAFIQGDASQPPGYTDTIIWSIDGSAETVTVNWFDQSASVSYASLDDSEPLLVTFQPRGLYGFWNLDPNGAGATQVAVTDHTGASVFARFSESSPNTINSSAKKYWNVGWGGEINSSTSASATILGARIFIVDAYDTHNDYGANPSSLYNPEYFGPAAVSGFVDSTTVDTGAAVAFNGSVWNYIKQCTAAYGVEFNMDYELVDAGISELGLDPSDFVAGSLSVSLGSEETGRSIDIINYNIQDEAFGTIYDASDDGKIFSVQPGETLVEQVQISSYPYQLVQPTLTSIAPAPPGTYYVIGSDDLPVAQAQWEAYGGSVTVAVNADSNSILDVTISAPSGIPGVDGPFSLAISDGGTTYPAFSVLGYGVFSEPETVNILTGADHATTAADVAATINNIFMDSIERCYDRGIWSTSWHSGPTVTLSGVIPTSAVPSFALIPGRMFTLRDCLYRISSADIGAAVTSIRATRHASVGDVDLVWSGQTVADFDSVWSEEKCSSFKTRPLLT